MPNLAPGPGKLRRLTRSILQWFDASKRDLPWRRDRDPYRIWVSEVMLQQTTVKAVLPHYRAFIEAFPSIQCLAAAEEQQVLARWSGLGYYRRARHLHAAAREVVSRYGGRIPSQPEQFRALPGVGDYTSAAVLSLAYDVPLAAVDGNVRRVLTRLFAIPAELEPATAQRLLGGLAHAMLPTHCPGRFNEAMMELGALVCAPRKPQCSSCPVEQSCEARRQGLERMLPAPRPSAVATRLRLAAAVVRSGQSILFQRRPKGSLLAGMWSLPMCEPAALRPSAALVAHLSEMCPGLSRLRRLGALRHAITRYRIELTVYAADVVAGEPTNPDWRWVEQERLGELGLPSLASKALALEGAELETSDRGVSKR